MKSQKQRGSRVIYVATSAKELPGHVQDWLSHSGHRAGSSPHIYDALATLARGKRPAAMIINIGSVDWNEFEFFDHIQRLSQKTRIYVTGNEHEDAKLEAAIERGARLFDAEAIKADLTESDIRVQQQPIPIGPAGLLAGSLRVEQSTSAVVVAKNAPAAPKIVTPAIAVEDSDSEDLAEPMRPAVRLVPANEPEDPAAVVPFPWNPNPDRPQRTPPRRNDSDLPANVGNDLPVRLSAEELEALLGQPPGFEARSSREERG